PALDHHAGAQREDEGLAAVLAGIELLALCAVLVQPAGVMDGDVAAGPGLGTGANGGVVVLQAGGGGGECHGCSFASGLKPLSVPARPHGRRPVPELSAASSRGCRSSAPLERSSSSAVTRPRPSRWKRTRWAGFPTTANR